jgi:hypothetical protein
MKYKYPRTYHLPWSDGKTDDDKILDDVSSFKNKEVIVTEKLDGENTTLYSDNFHARSLDGAHHPSRNWIKSLWGNIRYLIPENHRLCGENVFAKHAIHYRNLPTYFFVFSIWDGDICLSWDDTVKLASSLGLATAPLLYEGVFDENLIKSLHRETGVWGDPSEGYVVRTRGSFEYSEFKKNVAKYVRKNHVVESSRHWRTSTIIENKKS